MISFLFILIILYCFISSNSYLYNTIKYQYSNHLKMSQESNNIDSNNIGSRILFKATEIFGQLINKDNNNNSKNELKSTSKTLGLSTIDKTAQIIKEEYTRLFWVTGEMDLSLWEEDCTFADPFSSFGGPGSAMRFKSNANNLSKLLINPIGRVTEFEVIKDQSYKANDTSIERPADIVNIGWTFSSQLKLPWHPILAASGVTNHYNAKDTGKICLYKEQWKSKPWDVVKRLFVPAKLKVLKS